MSNEYLLISCICFTYAQCTSKAFSVFHLQHKSCCSKYSSTPCAVQNIRISLRRCRPLVILHIHSCLASQSCGTKALVRKLYTAHCRLSSSSALSSMKVVTTCVKHTRRATRRHPVIAADYYNEVRSDLSTYRGTV